MSLDDAILSLEPLIYAAAPGVVDNLGTLGGTFSGHNYNNIVYSYDQPFTMTQWCNRVVTGDYVAYTGMALRTGTASSSLRVETSYFSTSSQVVRARTPVANMTVTPPANRLAPYRGKTMNVRTAHFFLALVYTGTSFHFFRDGAVFDFWENPILPGDSSTYFNTGGTRFRNTAFFDRALTQEEVAACHTGNLDFPLRDQDDIPLGIVGYSPGPGAVLEPVQIEMT